MILSRPNSLHSDKLCMSPFYPYAALSVDFVAVCCHSWRAYTGQNHVLTFIIGVGSDFLVKRLHASRCWCLVIASLIFSAAQICALNVENPNFLGFLSAFTGLAYGFLFGVYPSLIAEAFGVHGMSTNWGCMTLAPVISGNIFNLFYGTVYDHHSVIRPGGVRECLDGLACYKSAYWVTFGACLVGLVVSLWTIQFARTRRTREVKSRDLDDWGMETVGKVYTPHGVISSEFGQDVVLWSWLAYPELMTIHWSRPVMVLFRRS